MDDPHLDYVPKFTKHMHQWPEIADLPISKVSESKTKVSVLRNSLLREDLEMVEFLPLKQHSRGIT